MKGPAHLIGVCALLGLVAGGGCLGDAPHGNPLDPESDEFRDVGSVSGRVGRFYPPHTPLADVQVRLSPGPFAARTDADGRYAFDAVPSGRYRLTAEQEGFAPAVDSVEVTLGEGAVRDLRLDGLPQVARLALRTVHVSRWWPQEDLYLLEVVADVEDPDGVADVEAVWLEIPGAGYVDTLQATAVSGRFAENISAAVLPAQSLHALMGEPFALRVRDRAGVEHGAGPQALVRVIEETPVVVAPQGLASLADDRPLLTWEPAGLPFPFTYRVDVVRVEADVQTVVQTYTAIPPDATSLQLPAALPRRGTYYWTLSVVDAFGNRSRSKEAGFQID